MRFAVWGARTIGSALVSRLATTEYASEISWINRTYDPIAHQTIDLEHGLTFAPTCRGIYAHPEESAGRVLKDAELLLLSLGGGVNEGQSRAALYPTNREIYRNTVIPAVREGFTGTAVVITNPVDLMTRLLWKEAGLPAARVLGLGTVVETARLRASLGAYLSPKRPAREIWAFAVGTHDERFVPIVPGAPALGASIPRAERAAMETWLRTEVAEGARRVRGGAPATVHPVVEGALDLCRAIAFDRHSVHTPSVLDPDSPDGLFYSVPCTVGRGGIVERHLDLLSERAVAAGLKWCREAMRATLRAAGDL